MTEHESEPRGFRSADILRRFNRWQSLPVAVLCVAATAFLVARFSEPQNVTRVVEPIVHVGSESAQRRVTVVAQGGIILDRLREAQEGKWAIMPAQIWTFADESRALSWFGTDEALVAGSDAEATAAQASMSWVIAGDGHIAVWLSNPSDRGLSAILVEAGPGCQSAEGGKSRWLAIWISKGPDVGGVIPAHEGGILFAPFDNSFKATCATIRKIYTY